MRKYFNFHNEENLTEIDVNEEGVVTLTLGDQTEEFDSIDEFAEFYAVARNVKPENLKNWTLVEDGDTYSYVLKAGTAGLDEDFDDLDSLDNEDLYSLDDLEDLEDEDGQDENLNNLDNLFDEDDEEENMTTYKLIKQVILENFFGWERYIIKNIVDFNNTEQYLNRDDYQEEYYLEDYEFVSKYDIIRYNLANILHDFVKSYSEQYSKLSSVVIFDILSGSVTDNHVQDDDGFSSGEEAKNVLSKGALSAKLAGRDVPIIQVTTTETDDDKNAIDSFEQKWLNEDNVDTQDGVLYAVNKKFYLVK